MLEAVLIGGSFGIFALAVGRLRRVDWLHAGASAVGYSIFMGILWLIGPGRGAATPDEFALVMFAALSGGLITWATYSRPRPAAD
jgi:hypothetical protein